MLSCRRRHLGRPGDGLYCQLESKCPRKARGQAPIRKRLHHQIDKCGAASAQTRHRVKVVFWY